MAYTGREGIALASPFRLKRAEGTSQELSGIGVECSPQLAGERRVLPKTLRVETVEKQENWIKICKGGKESWRKKKGLRV